MSRRVLSGSVWTLSIFLAVTFAPLSTAEMFQKVVSEFALENAVTKVGADIWITTKNGVFRFDREQNRLVPVAGLSRDYRVIAVGDEIWMTGHGEVFWLDRPQNRAIPVAAIPADAGSSSMYTASYRVISLNNEVWIETPFGSCFRFDRRLNHGVAVGGLSRVAGCTAVKVRNEIWFETHNGLFRFEARENRAVAVTGLRGAQWAAQLGLSAGHPFQASDAMDKRKVALLMNSPNEHVVPFAIGDDTWITSSYGLFRFDRQTNRAVPIAGIEGGVEDIKLIGGEIWIAGHQGVFRFDRRQRCAVGVEGIKVLNGEGIKSMRDEAWIVTEEGLFRLDAQTNRAVLISGVNGEIEHLESIGSQVWIGTEKGLFRLVRQEDRAAPIMGITGGVGQIVPTNQETWIETDEGVLRIPNNQDRAIEVPGAPHGPGAHISVIDRQVGGDVWIERAGALFRFDRSENRCGLKGNMGNYANVVEIDDKGVWIRAAQGIYQWRKGWTISLALAASRLLLPSIAGHRLWLAGTTSVWVDYPAATGRPGNVEAIIAASSEELFKKENDKNENHWSNIAELVYELKPSLGITELHISLKDSWGNEIHNQVLRGWVVAPWSLLLKAMPFLLVVWWLVCVVLAPYARGFHLLLMNPYVRKYASFGFVPILLTTLPSARRHLLKRYRRGLGNDPKLSAAKTYVIPEDFLHAGKFLTDLASHRTIMLHGQSGIGKSAFLQYLTYQCAIHGDGRFPIPVFVDLSVFEGLKVKDAVLSLLDKFGDLTDKSLGEAFLNQGGFLFVIDGLNEVDDATGREIAQFVDTERNRNCACLTTQVPTQTLLLVTFPRELNPLSTEKIDQLVRKLVPDGDQLLERFGETQYAICCVPLQLELFVELWAATHRVAENLDEVFQYSLASVLDRERWKKEGHEDYPERLSELAYRMVVEKRPYTPENHELPQAIEQVLIDEKWLVPRGTVMEFRHDAVRGYLASGYFRHRWSKLLSDSGAAVDSNWDSMIQFHLSQETGVEPTRALLLLLLDKDVETSRRIFEWLRTKRPDLLQGWQDEFSRMFGERVLGLTVARANPAQSTSAAR